jgi:hypothetical protein
LEFCKKNRITIERFLHTAAYDTAFMGEFLNKITPDDFTDSFVNRKRDRTLLRGLFREIDNLHGCTVLEKAGIANDTSSLALNKKLRLEFLSPSGYDELKKYCINTFQISREEEFKLKRKENNPEANLLSSVIMIKTDTWHVLLTSDALSYTIKRLSKSDLDRLNNRLIAAQIPHHGSQDSHFNDFWSQIPGKKQVPAFVSAGGKYGLPSKKIIEFFDKNYKEIHSTNFVGGFRDYFEEKKKKAKNTGYQNVEDPFYIYDKQFLDSLDYRTSSGYNAERIRCGEKQINFEKDGSFTVKTKSAYS